MAILYAIAIAVLTAYGTNLLWMSWRHARTDVRRDGDVPEPGMLPNPPSYWPEVTVQIPLYNEPLVAERVIDACAGLDYPSLEIQVLDDSTDETVPIAASRVAYWDRRGVDIAHIRRLEREGFKAGALQNGLRLARGEIIVVFDADFVPHSDFLRRAVPTLSSDPGLGMVQARWGHLNAEASLLTRIQSIGLDAHFAVEQRTRFLSGCYLNFNGTAGLWRRTCIEDAGGWDGETIAEDLDLSYRAQLAGWRFEFLGDVEVPAELPSTMTGLRTQQFRWAKGSVETARKLLRPMWRSGASRRQKIQGTFHLTGHFVFPFVLLAALLHAPLVAAQHAGTGPGTIYFGWMGIGLIGFGGFALAQLLAQRYLYVDWPQRLRAVPAFMAGTIGLSISNSKAVLEALRGIKSPFIRTPKFGSAEGTGETAHSGESTARSSRFDRAPTGTHQPPNVHREPPRADHQLPDANSQRAVEQRHPPADHRQPPVDQSHPPVDHRQPSNRLSVTAALEIAMLVYSIGGAGVLAVLGEWPALPFQLLFTAGFGLVVVATFQRASATPPATVSG